MRAQFLRPIALLVSVVLLMPWPALAQETTWLDEDLAPWNTPGMAIPAAMTSDGNPDPRCAERARPAETAEDDALVAEGWSLFLPYQRGWGVTLLWGLSSYDGMCRPMGFQAFVFVDGVFAGTVSPKPMDSRSDASADTVNLWFRDRLGAQFRRYAIDDPLCCPSGSVAVEYTIEETADGPVLNAVSATPSTP
jgi:hypothetical protein